mmetsp:Transcript_17716/g.35550  ORF Transcript_17716/g.35550 Transcript_17716/m.35550 type:complete len:215 (+) Transcript_17716:129-773(+)
MMDTDSHSDEGFDRINGKRIREDEGMDMDSPEDLEDSRKNHANRSSKYKCGVCGQVKRGHTCPAQRGNDLATQASIESADRQKLAQKLQLRLRNTHGDTEDTTATASVALAQHDTAPAPPQQAPSQRPKLTLAMPAPAIRHEGLPLSGTVSTKSLETFNVALTSVSTSTFLQNQQQQQQQHFQHQEIQQRQQQQVQQQQQYQQQYQQQQQQQQL